MKEKIINIHYKGVIYPVSLEAVLKALRKMRGIKLPKNFIKDLKEKIK